MTEYASRFCDTGAAAASKRMAVEMHGRVLDGKVDYEEDADLVMAHFSLAKYVARNVSATLPQGLERGEGDFEARQGLQRALYGMDPDLLPPYLGYLLGCLLRSEYTRINDELFNAVFAREIAEQNESGEGMKRYLEHLASESSKKEWVHQVLTGAGYSVTFE